MLWNVRYILIESEYHSPTASRTKALCCQSSSIAKIFDKKSPKKPVSFDTIWWIEWKKNKRIDCCKSICFHSSSALNSECVLSVSVYVLAHLSSVSFCVKMHVEMENVQFYTEKKTSNTFCHFSTEIPIVLACLWWWWWWNFALIFQYEILQLIWCNHGRMVSWRAFRQKFHFTV